MVSITRQRLEYIVVQRRVPSAETISAHTLKVTFLRPRESKPLKTTKRAYGSRNNWVKGLSSVLAIILGLTLLDFEAFHGFLGQSFYSKLKHKMGLKLQQIHRGSTCELDFTISDESDLHFGRCRLLHRSKQGQLAARKQKSPPCSFPTLSLRFEGRLAVLIIRGL